ncbi:MAG TPA: dihydroneopterin aldolase [Hyphomonadaceae bacterium]|nr:dihydroneopterin aldolase [Hyphomonadaceae bacterium]
MVGLTRNVEQALERSLQLATERKHAYATLEHLLLSLLDDRDAAEVLSGCKVDIDQLRAELVRYLDNDCASFVVGGGQQVHPTAAFQRVIQRAVLHVEAALGSEVSGANVLIAMIAEQDTHAADILEQHGLTHLTAETYLSQILGSGSKSTSEASSTSLSTEELLARQRAIRERAVAVAAARREVPPFYLIRISGMETSASIGIHGFEQAKRQRLMVSAVLFASAPASDADEIANVADYDFVRAGILALVESQHFNLQETLCRKILDLSEGRPGVLGMIVQTDKPDVYPGVAGVACRKARMGPALSGFPWWTVEV